MIANAIFKMTPNESKKFRDFQEAHAKCKTHDALGMKFTVCFTPGGLGSVVVVTCNVCSAKENITDFDTW